MTQRLRLIFFNTVIMGVLEKIRYCRGLALTFYVQRQQLFQNI